MLDRWHDAYHAEAPDYINCPYCQDELGIPCPRCSYLAIDTEDLAEHNRLNHRQGSALSLPTVSVDMETERGVWEETTFDPDVDPIDRIEDLEA
ncbi:hypothetical protein [Streptomyces sp. S1]|uniref:hypothetical protein n=1 Tax=Streptomyces sp. S1 TaxID=718288 RepID=UPI003D71B998